MPSTSAVYCGTSTASASTLLLRLSVDAERDDGDDEQPERERAEGDAEPGGEPQVAQLLHGGPLDGTGQSDR